MNDKNKIKWLICVTAGKWQLNSIIEAKKLGFSICAIDSNPNAEGFKVVDKFICEKLNNIKKIIKKIYELQISVKGVVCFNSDAGIKLASELRDYYGLTGMKSLVANKFISKDMQKEEWVANNIQTPEFYIIKSYTDFIKKIHIMNLPFIIKPIDSAGSRGITVVNTLIQDPIIFYNKAISNSKSKTVIIEKFVDGIEYVVDVLAIGKKIIPLGITEKEKVPNTSNTVSISLKTPSFNEAQKNKIKNYASKAFKVLGLENCSGHGELIIDKNGKIWMIEVAARGGGFLVFDKLVPMMSGINLPAEVTKLAMGYKLKKLLILSNAVHLCFFPTKQGEVKKIEGFDKISKIKNIEGKSFVSLGDKVEEPSTDGDRLGYLFAWGKNNQDVQNKINKAKKLIKYTII